MMPILEDVGAEEGMGQGDLLADVPLFESRHDGKPAAIAKTSHALVISRDCVAANKSSVMIAAVFPSPLQLSQEEDPTKRFELFRRHLAMLRDGGVSPDRFYLGSLRGATNRLVAHLDQLCALGLPPEAERAEWLKRHRVARLTAEFRASLPVRMFWAMGRVGFDDVTWYPDVDLDALVHAGQACVANLERERSTLAYQQSATSGGHANTAKDIEKRLEKVTADLAEWRTKVAPYEAERRRRGRSSGA